MTPHWNQIKFATGNANKLREAKEILGMDLEQVDLGDLPEVQTVDVEESVRDKCLRAHEALKAPVLVEDSGLVFDAWSGLPGALVKWFEKTTGCAGMLKMLEGFENRGAKAQCFVALHDGERIQVAKGEVQGKVAFELRGKNGFGWDVLFIPEGHDRTYAEMTAQEKNAISHRKKAFEALKAMLDLPN